MFRSGRKCSFEERLTSAIVFCVHESAADVCALPRARNSLARRAFTKGNLGDSLKRWLLACVALGAAFFGPLLSLQVSTPSALAPSSSTPVPGRSIAAHRRNPTSRANRTLVRLGDWPALSQTRCICPVTLLLWVSRAGGPVKLFILQQFELDVLCLMLYSPNISKPSLTLSPTQAKLQQHTTSCLTWSSVIFLLLLLAPCIFFL
jgi:cytochrome bd-type quinol oxidase subunit 2